MSLRVVILPDAASDLRHHSRYLNQKRPNHGHRFAATARKVFNQLARMPGLGAPVELRNPDLVGLRCRQIPRFHNHLIFYRTVDQRIEIVRVLHAAQDIDAILNPEDDSPDAEADAPGLP